MTVNARHWQAFVALIDQGSFTGAAKSLGTAQPNISARIRSLEISAGKVLFRRGYRKVTPTEHAEALYARVKPAIAALDSVTRELRPPQIG